MAIKKSLKEEVKEVNLEDKSYPLIYGYKDKEGNFHTDFSCREMNGNDEEAIGKPEIKSNGGKMLRVLIEGCCTRIGSIYKSDVSSSKWKETIQDLDVAEQDRIVLTIREISVGKELELNHTCPSEECKQKLVTFMDTDEIEIVDHNGVELIEFELPRGVKTKGGEVLKIGHMRRPKGLDREILDPIARKNLGMANTMLITKCVVDLEGSRMTDQLAKDMVTKDREYLLKLMQENDYGYKLETELTCSSCGEQFKTTLNVVNFI